MASRFWGVSPWELQDRDDKDFWIARAAMFKKAEGLGEAIAMDTAKKRQEFKNGTA